MYNDYGSIQNWERGPVQELIMKGFQTDLVEVGVGDNSIHDVAVKKDMSLEDLLEAIWEGRVTVSRDPWEDNFGRSLVDSETQMSETPQWIPSLHNVEAVLSEIRLVGQQRYLVDEQKSWVRVRWDGLSGDYGKDEEHLLEAKALLEKTFAVVLTAGSGTYAHSMELLCFMAPGKDENGYDRHIHQEEKNPPLLIQQAMIREDVWQALIGLKLSCDWGRSTNDINDYRESVSRFFTKLQVQREKLLESTPKRILSYWEIERAGREEYGAFLLSKDIVPFVFGLSSHSNILIEDGHADEDFANLVAEFSFIWKILMDVRYVWRPSDTAGPQFGEYKNHLAFLRAMVKTGLEAKKSRER